MPKITPVLKKRQKMVLNRPVKSQVLDVVNSLNNKKVDSILIYGLDKWTEAFLEAVIIRSKISEINFSDENDEKASYMQAIAGKYTNTLHRVHYVNKFMALNAPWASFLVVGSGEMFKSIVKSYPDIGSSFKDIIVIEGY